MAPRSYAHFALALAPSLVACNAIVGMDDVTLRSVAPDAGDSGVADTSRPDGGDASTTFALGGAAHFLQPGTTIRIANGADTVDVSQNGTFSLPRIAAGATYDLTVQTTAGNQICGVRSGGKGSAIADVGNVVVSCVAAKEFASAVALGQTYTTLSTGYVDFDLSNPVTLSLTNDLATKALVSLSIPQISPPPSGAATYAIFVDGQLATEGFIEDAASAYGVPAATYAVVDLAPGTHAVTAKWKTIYLPTSNQQPAAFDRARPMRLGAVMLDSVAGFSSVVSASANQAKALNQTTLAATEASPVSLTLPVPGPLLYLGRVATLGAQTVSDTTGVRAVLDLNGDRVQTSHVSGWGERNTLVTVGLVPSAAAGPYSLYSLVGGITGETYAKGDSSGKFTPVVGHDLFSWKPGTVAVRGLASGDHVTGSSTFAPVDVSAKIVLSVARDVLALVFVHETATWSTGSGNTGEIALDLDGARIATSAVRSTQPLAKGSPAPIVVQVRLAAGSHALSILSRSLGDGVGGSANAFHVVDASVNAVVLE